MTPAEQAQKLAAIRTLTREEIEGWRGALSAGTRSAFDGETAALADRERQLIREGR